MTMNQPTVFVLRLSGVYANEGVALLKAYPRERNREFSETQGRSVESDTAEMFGDGKRLHVPVELDYLLESVTGRVNMAREIKQLEAYLSQTVRLEFSPLYFQVQRARLSALVATEKGYRVTLKFYGSDHDFKDFDGSSVPLI